ncbi:MAG TPA: hypothetical protein VFB38_03175 [Chthonomonadaceae bacterium]|nr:hypothetical protein [Chthonomonadaceae bacterium]
MVEADIRGATPHLTIHITEAFRHEIVEIARERNVSLDEAATHLLESREFRFAPRLEAQLKAIIEESHRLKKDGTPDGRSQVKKRPPINTVKREAVAVVGPIKQSKNNNALGHYTILLSCDHTVPRAVSNGDAPPQVGKCYACKDCSRKVTG